MPGTTRESAPRWVVAQVRCDPGHARTTGEEVVEAPTSVQYISLEESVEVEICEHIVLALNLAGERETALSAVTLGRSSGR